MLLWGSVRARARGALGAHAGRWARTGGVGLAREMSANF